MVQRAHAKVRYEGMALTHLDASTATVNGMAPIPLYDYNCTGNSTGTGNSDAVLGRADGSKYIDHTINIKGWQPTHGNGPCELSEGPNATPAMYVLPGPGTSAGTAGSTTPSLVELTVWYKPSDHYVVASAAGVADAKAKGYTQIDSLGFVWPPPAAEDASSRYGLPSLSKDDPLYISQDYWRGRVWTPMLQIVYWGLSE